MATAHHFEGRLSWRAGGEGLTAGNHQMVFAERPALELSGAPQYRGDPSVHTAHENCVIANSVACEVDIQPEISTSA